MGRRMRAASQYRPSATSRCWCGAGDVCLETLRGGGIGRGRHDLGRRVFADHGGIEDCAESGRAKPIVDKVADEVKPVKDPARKSWRSRKSSRPPRMPGAQAAGAQAARAQAGAGRGQAGQGRADRRPRRGGAQARGGEEKTGSQEARRSEKREEARKPRKPGSASRRNTTRPRSRAASPCSISARRSARPRSARPSTTPLARSPTGSARRCR